METLLSLAVGLLFASGVYLMLRRNLIKFILGFGLLSNGINLLIFTMGRLRRAVPPIVPEHLEAPETLVANPLPQALILTAIVIGFGFTAFALTLLYSSYKKLGSLDTDVLAEPSAPENTQGGLL